MLSPVFSVTVDGLGRPFITSQVGLFFGASWATYVVRLDPDTLQPSWSVVYNWTENYRKPPAVAADQNGNLWVYGGDSNGLAQLLRYDAQGAQTFSRTVSSEVPLASQLAVDAAGNAYITGSVSTLLPMMNSLATCGTSYLSVLAPDGSMLQSTYLPRWVRYT
jgi:outer membrane protein assembly factor BamB